VHGTGTAGDRCAWQQHNSLLLSIRSCITVYCVAHTFRHRNARMTEPARKDSNDHRRLLPQSPVRSSYSSRLIFNWL